MKLSDYSLVGSINDDDEVAMLRPSGLAYVNVRATVQNFVNELLTLLGSETVAWSSIDLTGSDLADLEARAHASLTGIGTNTHAQIDSFIAAHSPAKVITFAPIESDAEVAVADGKIAFTVPAILNGYNLTAALASVHTPGTGIGATLIQIRRRRAGSEVDMLSTRVSLIADDYYAANGVINTSYDDLQTGDQIYADVDQIIASPPFGLSIALTFNI